MAVLSAERHDLHRSSQAGMVRCVAADTGAQETSLTFGGTSALLYHSTGHQMKTRILYESSHGRSCTFWLKCFWAVELLMCGTPGLHHIYFLVMMLGVAQKKSVGQIARTNFMESHVSDEKFSACEELRKFCCTLTVGYHLP